MTFDIDETEIDLLKSLTPYPRWFGAEFENSLNYLLSVGIAAKHQTGWTKGYRHQEAINWLASLKPPRIRTCKNCGG